MVKFNKISNKIIVSFTGLIVTMILILLFLINNYIEDTHLNIIKREMNEKLYFIEMKIKPKIIDNRIDARIVNILSEISKIIELRITVINFNGDVIFDSEIKKYSEMDNHRYRREIHSSIEIGKGESIRYSRTLKINMLYSAKKFENHIIRLAKPLYEIRENLSRIRKYILSIGIMILFISIIIIVIISRKITTPINETIMFAEKFSKGDYSSRILNYSDDEIGKLQISLNSLANSIVDKMNSLVFEQNKLDKTIQNINDGIIVIDNTKRILIINKKFKSFFNIEEDCIDRFHYEVIRNDRFNSIATELLQNNSIKNHDDILIDNRYYEINISRIREGESVKAVLIVLRDITEKKKIIQIKTDLVGNMSHELKTPVAILKGYIETIIENRNNKELVDNFLDKSLSNVERLDSIINDILKLHRLDTINDLTLENINLKEVIESCINILSPKAVKKNIAIINYSDDIPDIIISNRFFAEEIFFNLIDNAINYNNDNGNITIGSKNLDGKLIISIIDTGIGIPHEEIDRIFERFFRVDKSRSRSTGGTGLGLSIVKHACDILRWEIEVSSNSEGTVFTIEI